MREILFRAKRTDNGEWVEGYYFERKDTQGNIIESVIIDDAYEQITSGRRYMRSNLNNECFHVDSKTSGQFTGMTDRNGTKIFVGDVISADNGKQSSVSVVKFGEYYPKMFYKMLDMCVPGKRHLLARGFYAVSVDKGEEMILFQSPCVTVIGNIHDNPELLGGGG